jgi:hypothetical protein
MGDANKQKFITEIRVGNDVYSGPEITAQSWEAAERLAADLRIVVSGEATGN